MITNNWQIGLHPEKEMVVLNPTFKNSAVHFSVANIFQNIFTNNKMKCNSFLNKISGVKIMEIKNGVMCFEENLISFTNEKLNNKKEFYVYVLMNPLKEGIWFYNDYIFPYEPFYIGKGKNKRLYDHLNEALKTDSNSKKLNTIRKIIKLNNFPIIGRITEFMEEEKAYFIEEDIIRELWGYNCLTNISTQCCGSNGFKGKHHTEKTKAIMGSKGERNSHFGKGYLTAGKNNGMYGKSVWERWVELYGIEIANQKLKEKENKRKRTRELNGCEVPLKGTSLYNIWLNKYGKEEADRKLSQMKKKQSKSAQDFRIKNHIKILESIDINLIVDLYFLNLSINKIIENYNKINNSNLFFGLFKKIIKFYKLEEMGFIFGAKNKENLLNRTNFIEKNKNNKEKFYVAK